MVNNSTVSNNTEMTNLTEVSNETEKKCLLAKLKKPNIKGTLLKTKNSFKISFKNTALFIILSVVLFTVINYTGSFETYHSALCSVLLSFTIFLPFRFSLSEKGKTVFSYIVYFMGPLVSFICVELLNGNNILKDLTPDQIFLNMIWYYMVYIIMLIILRRIKISAFISMAVFIFVGIVNHYVLVFRGTTIFPCDILSWQTAINVSGSCDFTPDATIIISSAYAAIYILFVFKALSGKKLHISRLFSAPAVTVSIVYTIIFFFTPMLPAVGIYAQQWKTQANGYILNFTTALRYSRVSEPEGYDIDEVTKIQNKAGDSESVYNTSEYGGIRPKNIIAIMNESFDDFSQFENLELSEDPAPFLHSLSENTIKGRMYSPVTGGGTANVEYEFLTGNSLSFLPEGTVAYQLYIRDGAPSLASQMNDMGYHTTAFHPYLASGWNRRDVYSNFGFDDQIYSEDMIEQEIVRKYISDSCDYNRIFEITDGDDKPQFIFNVTMQNHSAYDKPWPNQKYHVTPTGNSKILASTTSASQYFSLIRESDDAIKELIEHYSQSDEPTMIVFFGDHQPPLGNKFYTSLYGKKLDSRTTEEVLEQYTTPFFIWTNYDIPEQDNVIISANYLGLLAMKTANMPLTGYQKFLDDMHEELPVFSNIAAIDKDGNIIPRDSIDSFTSEQQEFIRCYNYLNYYNLFDRDESETDGFFYLDTTQTANTKNDTT